MSSLKKKLDMHQIKISFILPIIQRIISKKHVFALTNRGIVPIYNTE